MKLYRFTYKDKQGRVREGQIETYLIFPIVEALMSMGFTDIEWTKIEQKGE